MFKMSLYTLYEKLERRELILYEKLCMEVYLDHEKSHVNPCPHNGIQCGLKDHCVKGLEQTNMVSTSQGAFVTCFQDMDHSNLKVSLSIFWKSLDQFTK